MNHPSFVDYINHPDFADFPEDIRENGKRLEQHIDWVLRRRGASRKAAVRDLLHHILQEQLGSQIARNRMAEGLRCESVKAMWNSKLKDRMDILDQSVQKERREKLFVLNAYKKKATEEEYEVLREQLDDILALDEPYDMGPEIMEELKQIENTYKTRKCDASTQTSPSRPWDLVES